MQPPPRLSVHGLAHALALGETTALAATKACLDRIAVEDGRIRAFITVTDSEAIAAAKASDARRAAGAPLGPLDGIPIAVKDNIDVAGVPCTAGVAAYRDRVPDRDATCVARLRAAGAVILGKLNMHEGALGATTDNGAFGRCQNPVRHGHTPGGSSGGSGAAVAAGMCAAALGTDTMGSVRIPAAYCGVMGLKPTYGLVPTQGVMPLSWSLDHVGPLAHGVQDLALLTQVMAGWEPATAESRHPPAGWTATFATRTGAHPLAGLRIGRPLQVDSVGCTQDVLDAYAAALDRLVALGAVIVPMEMPGWEPGKVRRAGLLVSEVEGFVVHRDMLTTRPDGFSDGFRAMLTFGAQTAAPKLAEAQRLMAEAAHACTAAFQADALDALVMPTAPQAAFPHGTPAPANQADLTALANITGRPAVSVPMGSTLDGLPLGLQFVGCTFGESDLLALVSAFVEDHRPS